MSEHLKHTKQELLQSAGALLHSTVDIVNGIHEMREVGQALVDQAEELRRLGVAILMVERLQRDAR